MAFVDIKRHTVWLVASANGFDAMDYEGKIIASNKFKSTLEYEVRRDHAEALGIWAIAPVVLPSKRQPNRKLGKRSRSVWARKHYSKP